MLGNISSDLALLQDFSTFEKNPSTASAVVTEVVAQVRALLAQEETSQQLAKAGKSGAGYLQWIRSVLSETNPDTFSRDLYRLAEGQLHDTHLGALAQQLLQILSESELPSASRAAHRLNVLAGRGGTVGEYAAQALRQVSQGEHYGPLAVALASTSFVGKGVGLLARRVLGSRGVVGLGLEIAGGAAKLGVESLAFPVASALGRGVFGQSMIIQDYWGEATHGLQIMGGLGLGARLGRLSYLSFHGVKASGAVTRFRTLSRFTQPASHLAPELSVLTAINYKQQGGELSFNLIGGMATMVQLRGAQGLNVVAFPGLPRLMQRLDFANYQAVKNAGAKGWRSVASKLTPHGNGFGFARQTAVAGGGVLPSKGEQSLIQSAMMRVSFSVYADKIDQIWKSVAGKRLKNVLDRERRSQLNQLTPIILAAYQKFAKEPMPEHWAENFPRSSANGVRIQAALEMINSRKLKFLDFLFKFRKYQSFIKKYHPHKPKIFTDTVETKNLLPNRRPNDWVLAQLEARMAKKGNLANFKKFIKDLRDKLRDEGIEAGHQNNAKVPLHRNDNTNLWERPAIDLGGGAKLQMGNLSEDLGTAVVFKNNTQQGPIYFFEGMSAQNYGALSRTLVMGGDLSEVLSERQEIFSASTPVELTRHDLTEHTVTMNRTWPKVRDLFSEPANLWDILNFLYVKRLGPKAKNTGIRALPNGELLIFFSYSNTGLVVRVDHNGNVKGPIYSTNKFESLTDLKNTLDKVGKAAGLDLSAPVAGSDRLEIFLPKAQKI